MADYKSKIKRLLALAESPNENEARAALLKARQLMAEHKISELDVKNVGKQSVKRLKSGISCTKRREPWLVYLSAVISENYCCKGCTTRVSRSKTYHLEFVGLEDDVEICVAVFKYAVDCIRQGIKLIKNEYSDWTWKILEQNGVAQELCAAYGTGFVLGVDLAFQKQTRENSEQFGLVLVAPKEVEQATVNWRHEEFHSRIPINPHSYEYAKGCYDGIKFDPSRRIKAAKQNIGG